MLVETLTRRWEEEEKSVAVLMETQALAQSQNRANAELKYALQAEQRALQAEKSLGTEVVAAPATDGAAPAAVVDAGGGGKKTRKKNKKKKKKQMGAGARSGVIYSNKYTMDSPKKFQKKALKNTWPYTVDDTAEAQSQPEPEAGAPRQRKLNHSPRLAEGEWHAHGDLEPEPEPGATDLQLVVVAEADVLPARERLANILTAGEQQRAGLAPTPAAIGAPMPKPALGAGAGGVAVRPQRAAPMVKEFFYVATDGKQSPEMPTAALASMLQSGVLTSETMIRAVGWPAWVPLAECKDSLAGALEGKMHTGDLEANKHPHDLAKHPAGTNVTNISMVEAGYTYTPLRQDTETASIAGENLLGSSLGNKPNEAANPSFNDVGVSSLPLLTAPAANIDAAAVTTTEPEPQQVSAVETRLRQLFTDIDADGNGTVSREELAAKLRADTEIEELLADAGNGSHYVFEQLDTDGDGIIDVDEFVKLCVPNDDDEDAEEDEEIPQSLEMTVTLDASSVRHAHPDDTSLLRKNGSLRFRQQTLAPTPTRQAALGASASFSLQHRAAPLSRFQRELASLVADGFDSADVQWALKKAGTGSEEARDTLLANLPERMPQYRLTEGGMVVRNKDGYVECGALENEYWRKRTSAGGMGASGPMVLGNASLGASGFSGA